MEQTGSKATLDEVKAMEKQMQELRNEGELKRRTLDAKQDAAAKAIQQALYELKHNKPNDRSDQDRYWAIVITDVEKAWAVFRTYVLG